MFTSGAGVLIYQNIGDLGHLISILILTLVMVGCFWYVIQHGRDYSNERVISPSPYFDYLLLLGCLLFISIQGYIQYQYEAFSALMEWNTFITAGFYFYVAYRYDHLGILSLAITAFASFWGLKVSSRHWQRGDFLDGSDLHITALIFSAVLMGIALYLDHKAIKKHFTFTYLNFCFLIFFAGALLGIFIDADFDLLFVFLIYAACIMAWYLSRTKKSFLFLLYAFVAGYVATTYLLGKYIFEDEPVLWYYYFLISCGGVIYLIIRYKRLFKR